MCTESESARLCSKCFQILTHFMLHTALSVGTGPLSAIELQRLDLNPVSLTPGSTSLITSYPASPCKATGEKYTGTYTRFKSQFQKLSMSPFFPLPSKNSSKQRKSVLDKTELWFLLAALPQVPHKHSSRVCPRLSVKMTARESKRTRRHTASGSPGLPSSALPSS